MIDTFKNKLEELLKLTDFKVGQETFNKINELKSQLIDEWNKREEALQLMSTWGYTDIVRYCKENNINTDVNRGPWLMKTIAQNILKEENNK